MPAKSQTIKNYEKEWKKVDALAKKNLPKSAFPEVKKIYAKAKQEKQDAQVLKALIYMTGLQTETREDNETLSIRELEAEIITSKQPVTSVLKNVLANVYLDYFNNNRWKLYDRTKTTNYDKFDITTWDAEDFHKKITELFLQSLKEEKLLQQTKLEMLDAVIIKGNTRHLRPTLYDLLGHSALEYFISDERDIKKPAYGFEIDQPSAYAPAAEFISKKFITKDSASLKHKALLIYQQLLAFHLNDEKPDALIDADIKRLQFVQNHSVHPDKESLYLKALNQIVNKYSNNPEAAQASYLIAHIYEQKANGYKPFGDSTNRYARLKVKEICEKVLTQKTESEGRVNCYNLLNAINEQSFDFNLEKINVPGQPFRALVRYRNISALYFRIVKADEKLKTDLENRRDEKYWPTLTKASAVKSWQQDLPDTKDYQHHNAEIKVDGLSVGEYFLLASPDKDFNEAKSLIGARMFYVSNISYVNSDKNYFVLHRETGQPLAKASVQVWEQRYDSKTNKYIKEKNKLYQTDENGYFQVEKYNTQNDLYGNFRYLLEITSKDDRLFTDDVLNNYYYINGPAETKPVTRFYLFTDRSIYRPGQTVHLKGIALTSTGGTNNKVLENYSTKVYLRDANYQKADSLDVKTNEFGSFSAKFQLPSSGLNGQFTIYTENNTGTASFRMEEYKRPKFFVEYEPLKGTYKVNDKIKITGIVKAYAGNNIDGAAVKYRVVREPRFLYPWLFRRWWQPPTQEMEIKHGETKTDKDGKFTVEFEAIPDLTIEKKFEPVFDYTVYADVTDINGETRSGEKSVSVSYKSLILKTAVAGFLPADSLKDLFIRTENMNGEYEPAKVTVKFTKLKEEKRLIRDRYWERPDQFVMTKEEYIKQFPFDEYDNETDYKNWEKGEISFNKTDSVKADGKWKLQDIKMNPGFYEIEISTKDKNGGEVKDIKYIELYDEKSSTLSKPEYLWTGLKNLTVEPGETAKLEMGTAADNLFVIHQVQKQNKTAEGQKYIFQQLSNEKKTFSFPAAETDRGGYGVSWLFVKHNRYYQLNQTINIPWTNKDLKIEYSTFRDKVLPGSEEKWKLKISGYKKDKIAAEMLASMYDASLDQFYPHIWAKPSIWYNYSGQTRWMGNINFAGIQSSHNYLPGKEYKNFNKQYDILIANYVFSPYYRNSTEPLWWLNPLNYAYGEVRNPRLMRLPKAVKDEEVMELSKTAPSFQHDMNPDVRWNDQNERARRKGGFDFDEDGISDQFDKEKTKTDAVQVRKNFNETAFFFPDLKTNENGDIEFSFTLPEALTKWKFQALAHTKDLAFGYSSKEIITQKELMLQPNAPRFLREGDKIEFSGKIVNLTDKELTGQVQLQLFDAATNEAVDGRFRNAMANQYFTVAAGQSEAVSFPLEIPYQFNKALVWRIVAKAGDKSDGEENALPVLTNRMLVTETMPLNMRGTGTREFKFEKLLASGSSSSLQHHALTVEYTTNPVWYAVQALPYIMEYPYECSEQTWNRYYANALASMIANSSPRIKQIFESWKTKDTATLISNLQKNEELKEVLLEETPWVLQAQNETQQKKNIALLFDLIRMSNEMNSAFEKLKQMQSPAGGFVWFKEGPDNPYITQYIITGIGHLKKLGVKTDKLSPIVQAALPYLDRQIKKEYDDLKKYKTDMNNYVPDHYEVQYLYMRSFFPEHKIEAKSKTAYDYFRTRAQKTWTKQSKYMQGMIALGLYRSYDVNTPAAIIKSLTELSINHEELGMYWKELTSGGYYWYQAPIETHSLLIEVYSEVSKDVKTIDDLKTWLLKNKQTTNWKTTKATAEACYALLLRGTSWLTTETAVEIKTGNVLFSSNDNKLEAGTGYYKKNIEGDKIKPEMGNISVSLTPNPSPDGERITTLPGGGRTTWGGVYWQYFEDLDKITFAETPLKLVKKLFVEKNTDRGPVLTPVNDGNFLKVGDKIKVRIELRVDRDMEYVHMKDMRASCMEPVNVLSSYKWQGGLGYYETTKDASTNFFIDYLRKGTYVFEYPLFVTNKGNFSNGITTIQCMYAPEFSSHSEGVRVNVE